MIKCTDVFKLLYKQVPEDSGVPSGGGWFGVFKPPPPKSRTPSKIVPNSTHL